MMSGHNTACLVLAVITVVRGRVTVMLWCMTHCRFLTTYDNGGEARWGCFGALQWAVKTTLMGGIAGGNEDGKLFGRRKVCRIGGVR